jgi:hypothetical protein
MNKETIIAIVLALLLFVIGSAFVAGQIEKKQTDAAPVENPAGDASLSETDRDTLDESGTDGVIRNPGAQENLKTFEQQKNLESAAQQESIPDPLIGQEAEGALPECRTYEQSRIRKGERCIDCQNGICKERTITY